MHPQGGDHRTQARYFAHLAVPGGEALTGSREELACVVLEVVLLAGLPPYSLEAAADGEETGVGLAPVPGRRHALRVLWRQDATASLHLPDELVHAQQAAMHQALRTIPLCSPVLGRRRTHRGSPGRARVQPPRLHVRPGQSCDHASCTPRPDSRAEMTFSASTKALLRTCRHTAYSPRRSSSGAADSFFPAQVSAHRAAGTATDSAHVRRAAADQARGGQQGRATSPSGRCQCAVSASFTPHVRSNYPWL